MTPEQRLETAIEQVAQAIHARYLVSIGELDPSVPTHRVWEDIPEPDKASNRDQIRHLLADFAELGLDLIDLEPGERSNVRIERDLLEVMAEREHNRWYSRKLKAGYVYGELRCDEPPHLTHPHLVAYADLEEPVKDLDREPVLAVAELLAEFGLGLGSAR